MENFFKNIKKHETHKETLIKFVGLVAILITYFSYLSWEYGAETGFIVSALTWSFFVLCTPIADAGFIIAFPVRLLFGVRMIYTVSTVSVFAVIFNLIVLNVSPQSYEITFITSLFYKILTTPFPYWSIIILCTIGTFLSIYFGDEMVDVFKHKDCTKYHKYGFKYKIITTIAIFVGIVLAYYYLLDSLGIKIN